MYLKNEPKIEPFDPRPGKKIHFFQNRVYRYYIQKWREKCKMSLLYTVTINSILIKSEFSPQDVDQMVQYWAHFLGTYDEYILT